MICAIFAVDSQGGLGKNGSLPWLKNSEDLQWFKKNTVGHIVVMGGNTWRDPVMPKPLPGRINVVVTSHSVDVPEVTVYNHDYKNRLGELQQANPDKNIFIIGGAQLLRDSSDIIDRILLTRFVDDYHCDVFIDTGHYLENFSLMEQTVGDTGTYQVWQRVRND